MDPRETILFSPRKKHQLIILYVLFVGIYYFFNNIIIMLYARWWRVPYFPRERSVWDPAVSIGIGFLLVRLVGSVGPVYAKITSTRTSATDRHARTANTQTSLTYIKCIHNAPSIL